MATADFLAMFPPVPTEQWERMIRENVPGPDYAKKLIWHPEEGLAVRPYYRAEDLAGLPFLDAQPGEYPYVRGTRRTGGWRICEEIDTIEPEEANRRAIDAVTMGAEEISFRRVRMENESDVTLTLANLNEIPVHFQNASQSSIRTVLDRLRQRPHAAGVSAGVDPLTDVEFTAEITRCGLSGFRPFTVDAVTFQERAAGTVEEAGFALSAAVDFLAEMRDRGLDADCAANAISFRFAMGPEFFVHIAKLRAFRMVWAQAVESFGGTREDAKAVIRACPSNWNKTVYDRHINVLRATTEAMAAILGGADSIMIAPFDECCGLQDESSRRLARNTQLILKREALLDRVADPVGGSYLIETLTNSIAKKSWKLFQELESAGGYPHAAWEILFSAVAIESGLTVAMRYFRIQKRYSNLISFRTEKDAERTITPKAIVRTSLPMLGINLIDTLSPFLDKAILGVLVPLALLGVYRISEYVASLNTLFVAPFIAFWPFISTLSASRRLEELGSAYKNVTLAIITLMFPFSLVLIELSGLALSLFGPSFAAQGTSVLLVLAAGTMVDAIAGPAGAVLRLADHYRLSLLINVLLLIVYCTATVFLARKYGLMGAAVARSATLILGNATYVIANRTFLRIFPYTLKHGALIGCGASILTIRFFLLAYHLALPVHILIAFAEVLAFSLCAWFILRNQLKQLPSYFKSVISAEG